MVVKQYDPPSPLLHRGSDKGGGVVQRILIGTRHKASGLQIQNWMHGPIFATTKYRAQLDLIPKTSSRYALQKPMHLKLKNSWTSEMLTWFFLITFCSWVHAIQSSDQHTFQKTFCSCHWLNLIGSSVDPVQLLDTILYWQRVQNNYRLPTGSEFNYRLGSGSGFNYRLCIGRQWVQNNYRLWRS